MTSLSGASGLFGQAGFGIVVEADSSGRTTVLSQARNGMAGADAEGRMLRLVADPGTGFAQFRGKSAAADLEFADRMAEALGAQEAQLGAYHAAVHRLLEEIPRLTGGLGSRRWSVRLPCDLRTAVIRTPEGALREIRRSESRFTVTVSTSDPQHSGKASVCLRSGPDALETPSLQHAVEAAARQADRLVGATPLPDCDLPAVLVLSPKAAGTMIHEVVGHLLEADNATHGVLDGKVTSPELTVADRGDRGEHWGGIGVDDRGCDTLPVPLLTTGEVSGLIDSGPGPGNGHARRVCYLDDVLPRLSVLEVAPGPHAPDDLIASVKAGLYVTEFSYGYVEPRSGRVRLRIREACRVAGGRLTGGVFGSGEIRTTAADLLAAVGAVGSDASSFPSLCLKRGQELAVANGGATMLLRVQR